MFKWNGVLIQKSQLFLWIQDIDYVFFLVSDCVIDNCGGKSTSTRGRINKNKQIWLWIYNSFIICILENTWLVETGDVVYFSIDQVDRTTFLNPM